MNLIQVVAYFPPCQGGMQNVARELSEHLSKKGHQVEIFTSNIGCKEGRLKSVKNLKIHYLKSWELAHTPITPSLFWRLMKIPKDSIIHVHTAQAFFPEVVMLVSKLRNIPYIAHIHGDAKPSGRLGFFLYPYQKFFLQKFLKNSRRVVTLNRYYKIITRKKYNLSSKITIISNGVNNNFFLDKSIRKRKKIYTLLFVGRLSIEKNIPLLIEAVSLLKNRVIMHVVGNGEKQQEIRELIKTKNLKNIILHGRKTGKDLLKLYNSSDIFLLASSYEGQPLVLLEAMATGTPIIASDINGTHELIDNVGILVRHPTSKNIAKEIDKLIENPKLRKKLSKKGVERAKGYRWNNIVSSFEQVYREVLEEHNKQLKNKTKLE